MTSINFHSDSVTDYVAVSADFSKEYESKVHDYELKIRCNLNKHFGENNLFIIGGDGVGVQVTHEDLGMVNRSVDTDLLHQLATDFKNVWPGYGYEDVSSGNRVTLSDQLKALLNDFIRVQLLDFDDDKLASQLRDIDDHLGSKLMSSEETTSVDGNTKHASQLGQIFEDIMRYDNLINYVDGRLQIPDNSDEVNLISYCKLITKDNSTDKEALIKITITHDKTVDRIVKPLVGVFEFKEADDVSSWSSNEYMLVKEDDDTHVLKTISGLTVVGGTGFEEFDSILVSYAAVKDSILDVIDSDNITKIYVHSDGKIYENSLIGTEFRYMTTGDTPVTYKYAATIANSEVWTITEDEDDGWTLSGTSGSTLVEADMSADLKIKLNAKRTFKMTRDLIVDFVLNPAAAPLVGTLSVPLLDDIVSEYDKELSVTAVITESSMPQMPGMEVMLDRDIRVTSYGGIALSTPSQTFNDASGTPVTLSYMSGQFWFQYQPTGMPWTTAVTWDVGTFDTVVGTYEFVLKIPPAPSS